MVTLQSSFADSQIAARIINLVFQKYPDALSITLWDGRQLSIGTGVPAFNLNFHHPRVIRDLVFYRDPVRLAEAYFNGDIDVSGNFNAAVQLRYYLESLKLTIRERASLVWDVLKLNVSPDPHVNLSSQENGPETIAFHYDVSNEFYQLWLDQRMVYSCAYFETSAQTLDQAQCNKLDHICRKLRLQPGETLLDIGCGWGALVCWAAHQYGVRAHGITLSRKQYEYAQRNIAKQGLHHLVTVDLLDYRDLPLNASYDKVVSVGMFEHVGLKNLATYFATVKRVLQPGGVFLNHGITTDRPGWQDSAATKLINRHVFPDGELDTIANILRRMETAAFEIVDVESLRPHYAMTLRHWVQRLEAHATQAIAYVGERTYRVWRLYMTGSAIQFEQGDTGIYQVLALSKDGKLPQLPLTRRDLYR